MTPAPTLPDYFEPVTDSEILAVRRIKGEFRRRCVVTAICSEEFALQEPEWLAESIPEAVKEILQSEDPRRRGGEDLPNLAEGEVEIARVILTDSVHGEVTSLRARQGGDQTIELRVVDEWRSDFTLPSTTIERPFTAEELLEFLAHCEPNPLDSDCRIRVHSWFYRELQQQFSTREATKKKPKATKWKKKQN